MEITVNGKTVNWDEVKKQAWDRICQQRGDLVVGDIVFVMESVERALKQAGSNIVVPRT